MMVFFFFFFLLLVYCSVGLPQKLDYAIPTRLFVFVLIAPNLIELPCARLLAKQFKNTESWMRVRLTKYQIYLYFSFFPTMFIRLINDEFRSENWTAMILISGVIKVALGLYAFFYVASQRQKFVDWFYKSIVTSLLLAQSIFFLLIMCIIFGFFQYDESLSYYAKYMIKDQNILNKTDSQYVQDLRDNNKIYFLMITIFRYTPCIYGVVLIILIIQYNWIKYHHNDKEMLQRVFKLTVYQSSYIFAASAVVFLLTGLCWMIYSTNLHNKQADDIDQFFKKYGISYDDMKECRKKANYTQDDMCNYSIDYIIITNMIKSMLINLSMLTILIFYYISIKKVIQDKAYKAELDRLAKAIECKIIKK